jgi:hypothetical protein
MWSELYAPKGSRKTLFVRLAILPSGSCVPLSILLRLPRSLVLLFTLHAGRFWPFPT